MPEIVVDGLLVRLGDKARLEEYWVIVDDRGRILGVATNEDKARRLASELKSGVVPPVRKKRDLTKVDPIEALIKEALDEV